MSVLPAAVADDPAAPLWTPPPAAFTASRLAGYLRWLREHRNRRFDDYAALYRWSVDDLEEFWGSVAEHFGVRFHQRPERVLEGARMPQVRWFPGATLNYAEYALDPARGSAPALLFAAEASPGADGRPGPAPRAEEWSRAELTRQVAAVAAALRRAGVRRGDRVAGYLPNLPATVVAFLAAASLGAVWAGCPTELSARGVVDRLGQIEPKVLFAVRRYRYGGKLIDRTDALREIVAGLPGLTDLVLVPGPGDATATAAAASAGFGPARPRVRDWSELTDPGPAGPGVEAAPALPAYEPVPFDHPLWILFSSGTTGTPKPIVQGHGGILLEHLKTLAFHLDLGPDDRFFWYTSSGWMMWNLLVSGLAVGATVVLYDGSPKHPDLGALWRFVQDERITYFGTSAPFLLACQKEGVRPGADCALDALRTLGVTGAPLPADGFRWVYAHVKSDLWLGSISGGTDVCTAFVLSNPLLPVRAGTLQCRGLGARIEAWDEEGRPVWDQVGELVLTAPLPSMPLFFWNDADGERLRGTYFDLYPAVWRHGDWIEIDSRDGHCVIHGRSDATLNRGGVRMGTSEFYRLVEELPEVAEALVVDTGGLGAAEEKLLLFVVARPGHQLDDALRERLRAKLRAELSPRHVPDAILAVAELPRTLNGKKLEVPVKRILQGIPPERAVSRAALANPEALRPFLEMAAAARPPVTPLAGAAR